MIDLDIPTFLRIPQEVRRESWRGRKLTKPKAATVKITRNEDASTRAFRRMIEKKEEEGIAVHAARARRREEAAGLMGAGCRTQTIAIQRRPLRAPR